MEDENLLYYRQREIEIYNISGYLLMQAYIIR
jgi:hypothetical protein